MNSRALDHIAKHDEANSKIIVAVGSTGAQVANTTDLSTLVCDVLAAGI